MISITVNRDGTVSTPSGNVFLGNKFENLDETLSFTFPDEFQEYNKYLIGYHKRRKVTVILPINNDIFYVTTGLTYLDGDWTLYAMCRQQVLDLSTDEEVDISPKEGEHVFISDGFSATVASNNIDLSVINSTVLDQNLKVIYEDLLKVKEELRSEQPIVIDLNIPMDLVDHAPGEIQSIELDDVKIDRNLFLDDEGKCKQFVNVRLSSSGVTMPYEFLCVFVGGTVNQINYCGSTIFWQPMIDTIEDSNIIALDFHENHDAENSFVFTLEFRPNLIAGEYYGFVKSAAGFDPEQHTVPVAIDGYGLMFVPTYPTLEKEWTLIDTFTYNQEDFADSPPVINKQYSGLDYTEICIVNDMKYSVPTEEQSGVSEQHLGSNTNLVYVLVNDKMVSILPLAPGGVCHLKYNGIYWQEKSYTFTYPDIQMYTQESAINVDTFNVGKCNKLSLKTNLDEVSTFVAGNAVTIESITFKIYAR